MALYLYGDRYRLLYRCHCVDGWSGKDCATQSVSSHSPVVATVAAESQCSPHGITLCDAPMFPLCYEHIPVTPLVSVSKSLPAQTNHDTSPDTYHMLHFRYPLCATHAPTVRTYLCLSRQVLINVLVQWSNTVSCAGTYNTVSNACVCDPGYLPPSCESATPNQVLL